MPGFSCILIFSILFFHTIQYIMGDLIPWFCYNSHFAFVSQPVSQCVSHVPFSFLIQHTLIQLLSNHFNSYSHYGHLQSLYDTRISRSFFTDIILTVSMKFSHLLLHTLFPGFPLNSVAFPPQMSMVCNGNDIV